MNEAPPSASKRVVVLRRAVGFIFIFGLGVAAATAVSLPPKYRTVEVNADEADGIGEILPGTADGVEALGPTDAAGGPTSLKKGGVVNTANYQCVAGKNGGKTDVGVSGNSVKIAANIVQDGTGASFLGQAIIGMQAIVDEANVRGVCGRKILLTYNNDSWGRDKGLKLIEDYIHDGYFALMVNPSSEGLDAAVLNGTIDQAGIPVIGSDGMLISQYRYIKGGNDLAKWIWPVAASTVSTMHIIAQHAADAGAQTFGLVYDNQYKFGVEGAQAFANSIDRLKQSGKDVRLVKSLGIEPGQTAYGNDAQTFNNACGTDIDRKCDLVAMLLDPSTAITWIKAGGTFGAKITAGPQTLFNHAFAVNCVDERKKLPGGQNCDLMVWTGYNPPVGALATQPDVAKYVADVRSRNEQADVENSFTQGAYLGARLFIHALEKTGPNLTRANLKATLDSLTYGSDLTNQLVWKSGHHFANTSMQAFRTAYSQDKGFLDWESANTGWIKDRWVGQL